MLISVKGKHGNAVTFHTMKAYRWSGDRVPLILNLGTRWRREVNFKLRPVYPLESLPAQLNSWPQCQAARFSKREISLTSPTI